MGMYNSANFPPLPFSVTSLCAPLMPSLTSFCPALLCLFYQGDARTLSELGLKHGSSIMLGQVGKPFAAAVLADAEDCPLAPADSLAASPEWMNGLFALLDRPTVASAAWGILQAVPTSMAVESLVANPSATNWARELGAEVPLWRKIYLCQVVEAKLLPAPQENLKDGGGSGGSGEDGGGDSSTAIAAEWRDAFVKSGGLNALLMVLEEQDLASLSPLQRSAGLAPILRVLKYCLVGALNTAAAASSASSFPSEASLSLDELSLDDGEDASSGSKNKGKGAKNVVTAAGASSSSSPSSAVLGAPFSAAAAAAVLKAVDLVRIMGSLFLVIRVGATSDVSLSTLEVAAISDALATVTVVAQRSDASTWAAVSASFPLEVLAQLLLESPEANLRREAAHTFIELLHGGYTLPSDSSSSSSSARQAPAAAVLGPLFLSAASLQALPVDAKTAHDYFNVCSALLQEGQAASSSSSSSASKKTAATAAAADWLNAPALRATLNDKIAALVAAGPRVVDDGSDSVLVGILNTYAALLEAHPEALAGSAAQQLATTLWHTLLMRLPQAAQADQVVAAAAAAAASSSASGSGSKSALAAAAGSASSSSSSSAATGPICGTPASRQAACRLLAAACKYQPKVAMNTCQEVAKFATSTTPPQAGTGGGYALMSMKSSSSPDDHIRTFERPGLNNTANR
jgi:hypothetical protein